MLFEVRAFGFKDNDVVRWRAPVFVGTRVPVSEEVGMGLIGRKSSGRWSVISDQ